MTHKELKDSRRGSLCSCFRKSHPWSLKESSQSTEMLKKLEVPPSVNTLEVEARDLFKARLDLVIEELKQLHQDELKKKKGASKELQGRKP